MGGVRCRLRGLGGSAHESILCRQMLPRLFVIRHDLGRSFEGGDCVAVTALFGISQTKMFPDWSIIVHQLGTFAEMIDCCLGLPCHEKAKPEL